MADGGYKCSRIQDAEVYSQQLKVHMSAVHEDTQWVEVKKELSNTQNICWSGACSYCTCKYNLHVQCLKIHACIYLF